LPGNERPQKADVLVFSEGQRRRGIKPEDLKAGGPPVQPTGSRDTAAARRA
jgi:hypothetical protein